MLPQSLKPQHISWCLPESEQLEMSLRGWGVSRGGAVSSASPTCPPELIYPLGNEGFPSSDKRADLGSAPEREEGPELYFQSFWLSQVDYLDDCRIIWWLSLIRHL